MDRRLIELWWGDLPARAARLSGSLGFVLRDGEYLESVPPVAAYAPPIALLVGLLAGWLHPLAQEPFTTSVLLMACAVAVGTISAAVGTWLFAGYVVGDLFVARGPAFGGGVPDDLKTYAAILLCDIVFAMLVVIIPITARALSAEVTARWFPRRGDLPTHVIAVVAVAALAFAWAQGALVLTRPFFTWHGLSVPGAEIQSLQLAAIVVPSIAALAMATRAVLETRLLTMAATRPAAEIRPARAPLPEPVALALRVAFAVFLLAGLMDSWVDALLVAIAMVALLLLREPALRRIETRLLVMLRLPILPRLLAGAVISAILSVLIVGIFGADGFVRPIVVSTLISLIVFSLLLPDSILGAAREASASPIAPPLPPPEPATRS
ncbi:MAG: hypothetical protein WCB51_10790 [Candidatus Dormiibacterota bacterium]